MGLESYKKNFSILALRTLYHQTLEFYSKPYIRSKFQICQIGLNENENVESPDPPDSKNTNFVNFGP